MTLAMAHDIWNESDQLVRSELFGREHDVFMGATIDTRTGCEGRLFFALPGERTDGHRFSMEAARLGGAALVISRNETAGEAAGSRVPYFLVREPLAALQDLSRAYRGSLPARVIAVTGSSGKTTTKELIRHALAPSYRVKSNPGNYNNHIGVPLTILDTAPNTERLVSEVGANHSGEIAFLCEMLRPGIAVITNIGDAHIGYFGGRDEIADTKAELLDSMPADGCAVLPGDDDYITMLRARSRGTTITFGFAGACDYRITAYRDVGDGCEFRVNDRPVRLRLPGRHNALNAAAALAVAARENVDWDSAVDSISRVEPLDGRGRIVTGGGVTLIDDAYNANPSSMRASLALLDGMSGRRSIAILGDMKELGRYSGALHEELGRHITGTGVMQVWWFGDEGERVHAGMRSAGGPARYRHFENLDELIAVACEEIRPGDIILVKGSHSCRLDRVVSAIQKQIESSGRN